MVGEVFSNVASKYDIMNDMMSGGMHRLWKDKLVEQLSPFAGMQHLDVAGGTGDIAFRVLKKIKAAEQSVAAQGRNLPSPGVVTILDINAEMLKEGKQRADKLGYKQGLTWVEGNAEELPLPSDSQDAYTCAFGIRNVTHRMEALHEAYRVLKPGGKLMILEFSHLDQTAASLGLQQLYDLYSFQVIPRLGQLVANDADSYKYLVESIRQFPTQEEFADMIRSAHFQGVSYENLVGGAVAIH